jgi:hypothetical protein
MDGLRLRQFIGAPKPLMPPGSHQRRDHSALKSYMDITLTPACATLQREYEARTGARAITAKSVDMIMASTPVAKDDPVSQSAALAQAQGPMGGQPEARETAPTSGAVSVSTPRRSMKERCVAWQHPAMRDVTVHGGRGLIPSWYCA